MPEPAMVNFANNIVEISRGFGFVRFPSVDEAKSFLDRYYPTIYLYGQSTSDGDEEAAKVRIAFSREREDRRAEKADGEWICKIVRHRGFLSDFGKANNKVHIRELPWTYEMSPLPNTSDW